MTQEEQDLLVGRVHRESKAAEAELERLLVKMEQTATDVKRLSDEISARVNRARNAGLKLLANGSMPFATHDAGFEHIENYTAVVDLEELKKLDVEIGQAVARTIQLNKQREKLGLND